MRNPFFSLVLTTLGRTDELERYLRSLADQTYRNLELIIVDQNEDNRLGPIIAPFCRQLSIRCLRSSRGASRGRNTGLAKVTGDIVGFPDDDCAYGPELLDAIRCFFEAEPEVDVLTGMVRDWSGEDVGRWDRQAGPLTRANLWTRHACASMFLRRGVLERIGQFDERIGVGCGTRFISGEETDLLIRAIDLGVKSFYDPRLVVLHPNKAVLQEGLVRAFGYGAGMGYVLRKNGTDVGQVLHILMRPAAGSVISLARGRWAHARYHASTFCGRLWGYAASPPYYNQTVAPFDPSIDYSPPSARRSSRT